jgi:hypothetical protein
LYKQKEGSPVLILEKLTEASCDVGVRYREVVQVLPFFKGGIFSVIIRSEPPEYLEEDFFGTGMKGHLEHYALIKT